MGCNRIRRAFEPISEEQGCDIAGELDAAESAALMVDITELAMADGQMTVGEGREIAVLARATLEGCRLSLKRSIEVQKRIDLFLGWTGRLDPDLYPRLPQLPVFAHDRALFRADAVCDADMRRRHPELGRATVGQMVRSDDWGEAA